MEAILEDGTVRHSWSHKVDDDVKSLAQKISDVCKGHKLFEIESALSYYKLKHLSNSKIS